MYASENHEEDEHDKVTSSLSVLEKRARKLYYVELSRITIEALARDYPIIRQLFAVRNSGQILRTAFRAAPGYCINNALLLVPIAAGKIPGLTGKIYHTEHVLEVPLFLLPGQ